MSPLIFTNHQILMYPKICIFCQNKQIVQNLLRRLLPVLVLNFFIPEKLESYQVLQIWYPTAQIFKLGVEKLNSGGKKEETSESPTAGGFFSIRQVGGCGCRLEQQDGDE